MQATNRRLRRSLAPTLAQTLALSLAWLATACGGGGGGSTGPAGAILSVLQDLDADPNGLVTVVSFDGKAPNTLVAGDFDASGTQTAVSVVVAGTTATVTWDERVGTATDVRVLGVASIDDSFADVATSNATAPTFTIANATQAADFADDAFEVHFSGPRVDEAQAEDAAGWELSIDGELVDLSSATLDLDVNTQVLSVVLGGGAGLHADFELVAVAVDSVADVDVDDAAVAGTAVGDAVLPTLLSAEQNLTEDEFGRVIDFTFSEAMDPLFSTELSDYIVLFPVFATAVEQPAADVVRVTFNAPIVPGFATITFGDLVDAHGNALAAPNTPVTSPGFTQAFSTDTAVVTVANVGGDYLQVVTDWAFVESYAEDASNWTFEVEGNPIDVSGETFTYDLESKTLTVTLSDDYDNGDAFFVAATNVYSIDGTTFSDSIVGAIDGDVAAAALSSVTQNRNVDPDGLTYDLLFSEQLDEVQAETLANYAASGGATLQTAVLQGDLRTVRITTDQVVLPGEHTFDVSSAEDLAGNTSAADLANAVASTDTTAPAPTAQVADAPEGSNNDSLTVSFTDDMTEADVEDPTNWSFQSPIGTPVDTSLASVVYTAATNTAVLTFDGGDGINLQGRTDFLMSFSNMRDIGGNTIVAGALYGIVEAEVNSPRLISVFQPTGGANLVHVRFSEEVDELDDLGGLTSYTLRDAGGVAQGTASGATLDSDGMGAELVFGVVITPGVHTLDVRGVVDLAGNALFPVSQHAIDTEDTNSLTSNWAMALTESGEDNDSFQVAFSEVMNPRGITDPASYHVYTGGGDVDLSQARITFDGVSTVTFELDAAGAFAIDGTDTYFLETTNAGLQSEQGEYETAAITWVPQAPIGDAVAPDFSALRVMLDAQDSALSVIMDLDEAIRTDDGSDESLVDIGGTNPDTLEQLGPRTVRATFGGGVTAGQTINFTVRDLAGNAGAASAAIQAADAAQPLLSSVQAIATSGSGGDELRLTFDEPLLGGPVLDLSNYTLTEDGNAVSLTGSTVRYVSGTNTVRILLPEGTNLTDGATAAIGVSNMYDLSGNAMAVAGALSIAVAGDATAPDLSAAFINYRADASGLVVDVLVSEELRADEAELAANWSASGLQAIASVEALRDDLYRITLLSPLAVGDTLTVAGVHDHAGNAIGVATLNPVD
ncbi:MAG: hypothetical protein EPO68_11365 [Planctomycetota bacterium]|nr:MAG: hypothetical protein EPO68_11365 [Planctomycetota bacterium]